MSGERPGLPIPPGLLVPGPAPLHAEVVRAMARPLFNYRGPRMKGLMDRIRDRTCRFFGVSRPPLLLAGSGTGAIEAALVNTLSPGDRVLGLSGGVFADRFLAIARAHGLDAGSLRTPWGQPADPDRFEAALRSRPDTRAVLLTHSETSTGVLHPLPELIASARRAGSALVLVDAVSSLGAVPVPIEDCDVVFTASHKAWGLPPAMAIAFVSDRAEEAGRVARLPRFYWDFTRYREAHERGSVPFTPELPILFAMEVGLGLLLEEGRERVFRRHAETAASVRAGLRAAGLTLVAADRFASPTVTAAWLPDGIAWPDLSRRLDTEHGVSLGGGLGRLAGKIFRVGHLGWTSPAQVAPALNAIRESLAALAARDD